jgi:nucleoid-associated protein YgaU
MADQKAEIFRVDNPNTKVTCQFNPKDFTITRGIKWTHRVINGKDVGEMEFGGGEAQDLTVDLIFDSTDTGSAVTSKYSALLAMAEIDTSKVNSSTHKGEPPEVKFQWGSYMSFTGVIKSITQNFTFFSGDGTPLRARVKVVFSETAHPPSGQNPTTRTESRKTWVVREGETLAWIAFQEYGDASQWRYIAETNGLDNPLDLHSGQVLKLLPL